MQRILLASVGQKERPLRRDSNGYRNGAGALYGDGVLLHLHGRAGWLAIEILGIELQISGAPRDAIVVTDDYRRQTDDGRTGNIQAGRLQMHEVPRRGNGELQVRVVRQNRLAAGGARSRHRPGVRTWLRLVAGA